MTPAEQKVINFIRDNNLFSAGDKILCALSGGPDSVFLLTFLLKFRRKYKIDIAALHLNHMLRGRSADSDEKFCRNLCGVKKIPFYSVKADIKSEARKQKISVEEAGRQARYSFLQSAAEKNGYTKIATGHNLDDNTETVLLNLIKGTGLKGISGIPVKRGNIIRPLLGISKAEIRSYLLKNKVSSIADKTNLSNDYERNYIRNKIIPLLRKRLNPSLDEAVLRSSGIFRILASYIDRKTDEAAGIVMENDEIIKINIDKLRMQDKELHTEIIRKIIERNFMAGLSFKDTMSVLSLLDKKTGAQVQLPGKISVIRERTYLAVLEKSAFRNIELKINAGKRCKLNGSYLLISEWKKKPVFNNDKNIEFIDGGRLGSEFIVRRWRPGDKFTPIGMKGTVKVSDFLNAEKVPSAARQARLVLTWNNEIIWVIGSRINEKYKIKQETKRILRLWMK